MHWYFEDRFVQDNELIGVIHKEHFGERSVFAIKGVSFDSCQFSEKQIGAGFCGRVGQEGGSEHVKIRNLDTGVSAEDSAPGACFFFAFQFMSPQNEERSNTRHFGLILNISV